MLDRLRQDLRRAGQARAGVWLMPSLIMRRYVDDADLSSDCKCFVRLSAPPAVVVVPAAFFLSVLSPDAREPNAMICLAYIGGVIVAASVAALGVGLLKRPQGWRAFNSQIHRAAHRTVE